MNRSVSSEPNLMHSETNRQRSLIAVRKSRKQIESDALSLSNRISLLQKEEQKIWKNLELAKAKAHELYLVKKRDTNKSKERFIKNEESNMSSKGRQANSMLLRKQREESIVNLKEALMRQRQKEVQMVKRQAEMFKMRKQDLEDRIKVENRNKMLVIKRDELLSNFKKKAFYEEKLQRVKQLQQKKLDEEEEFKVTKELEVLNMEKAEIELVQRIQYAKSMQKQIYQNLESMLAADVEEGAQENQDRPQKSLTARESEPMLGNLRMRSLNGSMVMGVEEHEGVLKTQLQDKPSSRGVRRLSHR